MLDSLQGMFDEASLGTHSKKYMLWEFLEEYDVQQDADAEANIFVRYYGTSRSHCGWGRHIDDLSSYRTPDMKPLFLHTCYKLYPAAVRAAQIDERPDVEIESL